MRTCGANILGLFDDDPRKFPFERMDQPVRNRPGSRHEQNHSSRLNEPFVPAAPVDLDLALYVPVRQVPS